MPQMGWLARQDGYDPNAFDVPLEQTYDPRFNQTWPGQLAQDAMGAVLAPGRALQSTEPITTEQMIKPAADLAGLVTGGSYAAPAQRGASGAGIRAYHSSPHDFDKFDIAKIGTGEGAQAYGHGLYFAESPAVSGRGGQYWKQFANRGSSGENTATEYLARADFDREKAAQTLRDLLANPPPYTSGYNKMTQERMRTEALKLLESDKHIGPRTYEVNINADPAHMLDWDKGLAGQSDVVRQNLLAAQDRLLTGNYQFGAVRGEGGFHPRIDSSSGQKTYRDVTLPTRDEASAAGRERLLETVMRPKTPVESQRLHEAGIPGIKYLDQGSRRVPADIERMHRELAGYRERGNKSAVAALEQQIADAQRAALSSNYVVFDPGIIDIMKKYGIVGTAGGTMGALAAQDRYE